MSANKLRWGVLGCAGIAIRAVIPGTKLSETGEVAAIASRGIEKAQETAAKLDIPKAYGSYEELLADGEIDAVYIPLPNHLHKEWTIRAAEAGKHVLCEKPAALTAAEMEEMAAACERAGVTFAEAFMYRYHPRYAMIKEIIASGEIGELRGFHGTFTFNSAGNSNNVRFKQSMGGGSLYDVGVYPLTAARMILDCEPEAATMHALFSPQHDNVDMMASGLVEFSGGVALTFDCGMWAFGRNNLEILGTDGRIELPRAYTAGQDAGDNFFVTTKSGRREVEVPRVNQYALQADAFARCVLNGEPLPYSPADAIAGMRVVDACLTSARERRRVEL
ncbi:dTDP-3,4-didehydro-2,6-dideoxy-alpha-D-glucose 3-reductase [Paenibacillus solanacearum]|uniref:dTDP-3,4-didehydro-2,6-dideoxy-alpha-D-glucose 3-reductase n=1 Tax=Paenibacillus solanacearum TaxID=2048548 RepID=A0A916NKH5_9BACL|nr:Gfo/Idh/MocA family oxidoreductase [Paenibacillus solanacearum]CAG7645301.1 dTDP-3,4-didehydro-2,6-dideoxy-alpha-D-glucose 3-reductase [Paenibacillus solanacearum]